MKAWVAGLGLALALGAGASRAACPAAEPLTDAPLQSPGWQWRLSFTPDGTRMFWTETQGFWPQTRERAVIKTARRVDSVWSAAETASFSGQHTDFDPFVTPDGRWLYFSSDRPVEGVAGGDLNLWRFDLREPSKPPQFLGWTVNRPGHDELYASLDAQGRLYFARVEAPIPRSDVGIWRAEPLADGSFAAPHPVPGGVNSEARWEFNPEISPDGLTLLFVRLDPPRAQAPLGLGLGDLYVARALGEGFDAGRNLGPCINSPADEYHPSMRWAEQRLVFVRNTGKGGRFMGTPLDVSGPISKGRER